MTHTPQPVPFPAPAQTASARRTLALLATLVDGCLCPPHTGTHHAPQDVGFGGARDSVDADDGNCGAQTARRGMGRFNANDAMASVPTLGSGH